jgi:hypothetical protein
MAMGPNPLDEPNPFAAGAPPMPMPMVPQGQTPLGNLAGLAGKIAPFFIPGVPPLAATLNAMGVNNPLLLSAIMQNDPSQQAGPEWEAGARGAAARAALSPSPYGYTPSPLMQSDLSAAGYGLEPGVY